MNTVLADLPLWQVGLRVGVVIVAGVLLIHVLWRIMCCCWHKYRTARYQEINPNQEEEDLTLEIEE
jgi:hypothetical protein